MEHDFKVEFKPFAIGQIKQFLAISNYRIDEYIDIFAPEFRTFHSAIYKLKIFCDSYDSDSVKCLDFVENHQLCKPRPCLEWKGYKKCFLILITLSDSP